MKKLKLISTVGLMLMVLACTGQQNDMKNIENVITEFSKAGDENNAEKLSTYLDDNFRIVMNRLFGSKEVGIMPKNVYLDKIKSKKFGGDERDVKIENVVINGSTASAKVTLHGMKMTTVSTIILIQDASGKWKLVSDVPIIV